MALNININVDSRLSASSLEAQLRKRFEKIEADRLRKTEQEIREELQSGTAETGGGSLADARARARARARGIIKPGQGLDRLRQKPAAYLTIQKVLVDLPFVAVWLFGDVFSLFPGDVHPFEPESVPELVGGEIIENCYQLLGRRSIDIGAGKVMILRSPEFNSKIYSGHTLISGSRANYVEPGWLRRDFSGSSTGPFLQNWEKTGSVERDVYAPQGDDPFGPPEIVGTYYHVYGNLTYEWDYPRGRNAYNPTVMLPVGDNRCILVACSLTVLNNFFLTASVYYADTEDSDGIPATGYYGALEDPYDADFNEFSVQFSWEAALADPFDASVDKQFFRLAPDTTVDDITVTPVSSYSLDVKCYLCDNTSISEIACPENLRLVIEDSFEIVEREFNITVLSAEQDASSINTVTTIGIEAKFKDYNFWLNKSTGSNVANGFAAFDTSIIPYDWSNFSEQSPGERHGSVSTPEVYTKLLKYRQYIEEVPGSVYQSNSLPIPNTLGSPFSVLYSKETRNPSDTRRGVDADTWLRAYLSGGYMAFAYKGQALRARVLPFAGLPNLDEWQEQPPYVYEGRLINGRDYFFPSVWSIQTADLVYDPREVYSVSFYYDVSTLGVSWTGGNDDFCVLMARALGFDSTITGLTSEEKAAQESA